MERVRQHFSLSLEDVANPVFIAGHTRGKLLITVATKLKILANGNFLELNG